MCMFSNRLVLCYAHTHAIASIPPSTISQSTSIAIGVGIGVGVGVPVLLALILVIVGVVYCKAKGQKLEYNIIIIILTFVVFPVLWTLTLRWKPKVREGVGGTWAPVVIHLLGWHWSLQCTNTLADMYTVHIVTISGLLFCPVQSPLWILFKEGSQLLGYSIRWDSSRENVVSFIHITVIKIIHVWIAITFER